MNKHRGSNFDDYLKEKGLSKEVSTLAQKRWETLRSEVTSETNDTPEVLNNPPRRANGFWHRLQHRITHLFS